MAGILCDRPDAWMGWEHLQPFPARIQPEYGGEINHTWSIWVGTPSAPLLVILGRELTFFTWPLPITFEHYWRLWFHNMGTTFRVAHSPRLLDVAENHPHRCRMLWCLPQPWVEKQSFLFYQGTSTNLQYPLWTSVWAGPNPKKHRDMHGLILAFLQLSTFTVATIGSLWLSVV